MSEDRIEKRLEIKAPVARVWKALTDAQQFGEWFRVHVETPFVPGEVSWVQNRHPGWEHLRFDLHIERMEAPRLFSYRWHPYPADPKVDYSKEPMTLVEFTLAAQGDHTLLTVVESGFEKLAAGQRRIEALKMNTGGWEAQLRNIAKYAEHAR